MAMDPAAMPAQEAGAPAAPQEGGGGNDVMDLITNISDGLAMLVDAASEAAPEVSQALQKVNDDYKAVIDQLISAQGGQDPAAAQAPGMSPAGGMPEAAGAKGAVPVGAPPKGAVPVGRR
jgi:hypothetical protein